MPTIDDKEFGNITVRRSSVSKSLRISIAPSGSVRVSAPSILPLIIVRQYINSSRAKIRQLLERTHTDQQYADGDQIGKEHSLHVQHGSRTQVSRHGKIITVQLVDKDTLASTRTQALIRKEVAIALRIEARKYLPKRLEHLAKEMNETYAKVRFSHASSRWGSCSSNRTISLNIALMRLPYDIIDYVLIHEIAHLQHMDHSKAFWHRVEQFDPHFKKHRAVLKNHTPSI